MYIHVCIYFASFLSLMIQSIVDCTGERKETEILRRRVLDILRVLEWHVPLHPQVVLHNVQTTNHLREYQNLQSEVHMYMYMLMRDEKEGRKKPARSYKQQGKATQHTQHVRLHTTSYWSCTHTDLVSTLFEFGQEFIDEHQLPRGLYERVLYCLCRFLCLPVSHNLLLCSCTWYSTGLEF